MIVIGWLRDDPALEFDAAAERLAREARIQAPTGADAVVRARDYLKQLYRSMYDEVVIAANDWGVPARGGQDRAQAAARSAAEERL